MALDTMSSDRRPSDAMSSDSKSSDSKSSDTMSTDSDSQSKEEKEEEEEQQGKGHIHSSLLNTTQLNSILDYIDTIPSPLTRASAKIYLARLHEASSSRDARAYIMLFRSGKTIRNDERLERYKHLNRYFEAPLVTETETEIKMVGLHDQFKIKTEMQMEMGEEWDVDDYEVRLDFGRIYVGALFRLGFIEPDGDRAGMNDDHAGDDRLADEL